MEDNDNKLKELCLVCSEFMGQLKNGLSELTQWSHKPLFQIFETFINMNISQHDIIDRQICQNCLIKFNELDEHQMIVEKIQTDLLQLYNKSLDESLDTKNVVKMENFEIAEVDVAEYEHQLPSETDDFDLDYSYQQRVKRKYKKRSRDEYDDYYHKKKSKHERREDDPTKGFTVMEIDGKKIFKCDICHKILHRRLKMHLGTHSSERKVKCEECGALFKTLACLYTHRKIHRERKYHVCDICGMRYLQKVQLRKHFDAIHLMKKDHICAVCGKSYSRDSTLQVHMLTHDGEKNVICSVCGFRTHTKSKMTRHMKSHTGERNYSCDICGKRFLYSYNVIAHVNYVHKGMRYKVDETKLICNICGKKFPKQKKVKEHMAEVHNFKEEGEALDEPVEWTGYKNDLNAVYKSDLNVTM